MSSIYASYDAITHHIRAIYSGISLLTFTRAVSAFFQISGTHHRLWNAGTLIQGVKQKLADRSRLIET